MIENEAGREMWLFEGVEIPNFGLNAVSGRPQEEYGIEPTRFDEIRRGTWDVDARIDDMNAGGILASMCFPSFPQFCGQVFANTDDKDLALAVLQAYNDWHVEEWAGAHPGRFIPLVARALLGSRTDGRRGPPDGGEGLCGRSPGPRTPRSSGCPASTASTGTRSGERATSTAWSCVCTSARRRR